MLRMLGRVVGIVRVRVRVRGEREKDVCCRLELQLLVVSLRWCSLAHLRPHRTGRT